MPTHLDAIGPEDRVLVRGAALTFIDVVRACDPAVFLPVTRTGRLMAVKPEFDGVEAADIIAAGSRLLADAPDTPALITALALTARRLLERAGRPGDVDAVLAGSGGDPDGEWAVGLAWRECYPALVERASYAGRDSLEGFGELARRLERVAFGPPPESMEHLQGLIDSGKVDLTHLGRGTEDLADLVRDTGATVVVDAVIPPPGVVEGTLEHWLVEQGLARIRLGTRGLDVAPDGTVVGQTSLAAVGRMTEDVVLGNDTLSRTLHDVIPRWARRLVPGPAQAHGIPPLTARLELWAAGLSSDPARCRELIAEFGSPVNVLHPGPMLANVTDLVDAGASCGVDTRIFFARKANKGLVFVDTVRDAGHGVDVASERELAQVLDRGVPGDRIILSAAVKPDRLLELAIAHGVTISADSRAELHRISALAGERTAHVAPRVAPDPATMPPTRFGERVAQWAGVGHLPGVEIVGLHVHLLATPPPTVPPPSGAATSATCLSTPATPLFIDLGGGVAHELPRRPAQWRATTRRAGVLVATHPLHVRLTLHIYPFHQSPVRGEWLREVLADGVAEMLLERGLRLHLEPGRSLLDGCGMILAEVAFVKERSDGLPLVGLAMNRTQCRTTSDDYLVDPLHVTDAPDGEEIEAYLVGAYCIEDELILRRRIRFPRGVRPGDTIALPNTAGYFMHILESASHQIPLAKNVVWPGTLDDIDA